MSRRGEDATALHRIGDVLERLEGRLIAGQRQQDAQANPERELELTDPMATYDAVGRKQPHRLSAMHYVRAMPAVFFGDRRLRRVPAQAVTLVEGQTRVDCPCGPTFVVQVEAGDLTKCVNCERYYLSDGFRLWVAYGDMEPPAGT